MRECKISVIPALPNGISIWCSTCCENVAWGGEFSVEEITATAEGHLRVMARARAAARAVTHGS